MRQKYFWAFSLNCKCNRFVFVGKWILASDWFVLLVSLYCFYRKETELCYIENWTLQRIKQYTVHVVCCCLCGVITNSRLAQ